MIYTIFLLIVTNLVDIFIHLFMILNLNRVSFYSGFFCFLSSTEAFSATCNSNMAEYCCPPNSEKYLAATYATTGSTASIVNGDLTTEFYQSGSSASGKGVLVIPDVYGWNGGRCEMFKCPLLRADRIYVHSMQEHAILPTTSPNKDIMLLFQSCCSKAVGTFFGGWHGW